MVQPEKGKRRQVNSIISCISAADKRKPSSDDSEFAQLCREAKIVQKLVVIGGGNMGSALVKGFLKAGKR